MSARICQTSGKQAFATEREARDAIASRRQRERKPTPSRAYRCPHCGAWHLTSKITPRRSA